MSAGMRVQIPIILRNITAGRLHPAKPFHHKQHGRMMAALTVYCRSFGEDVSEAALLYKICVKRRA